MSFEVLSSERVASTGEGALTIQDESLGVLAVASSCIEVAYDAAADPEDPAYQGNYRISVTSELAENARPDVMEMFGDWWPWLGETGNRLRYEITKYPICHSSGRQSDNHPLRGLQRAFGISTSRVQDGNKRTDSFTLTVGAGNLQAAAARLPQNCWTYAFIDNAGKSFYSTEQLEASLAGNGTIIVAPAPTGSDSLSFYDRVIYPLHDNSMHVQGAAVMGTPAVQTLIASQLQLRAPGDEFKLDLFFDSGPEIIDGFYQDYRTDWEEGNFGVPYYGLRRRIPYILAAGSRARLNEELEAADAIRTSGLDAGQVQAARAKMDRPGNMLDELEPVVSSIPERYMALVRFSVSK